MWTGRFKETTSNLLRDFSESVSFDHKLYAHDIAGSKAHAAGLLAAGILSSTEHDEIVAGLDAIGRDIAEGRFEWDVSLEDVHMNIERELTHRIGPAGAKLHTARSRNDQVALDVRLYCREKAGEIRNQLRGLMAALVRFADRHPGALLPGYTHLQRAQPVFLAHHLLAYVEMFARDADRLQNALPRINVMPLGSGAIAGSTIPIDRTIAANILGFPALTRNSMDAVSDRDFVCELLFIIALSGIHLSRLSEDLILWSSAEFGFLTLSDAFTTGSSLMPQKKNPDAAELTRGKSGRLVGNLTSLLVTLKGLPMTYNRDMQEDKEPLFDSVLTITRVLDVFTGMLDGAVWNTAKAGEAARDPMLTATDLADYLVLKGIPFRQAHEAVGQLVALAVGSGRPLDQLSPQEMAGIHPAFGPDAVALLDPAVSLSKRAAIGAPSPANVEAELARWRLELGIAQ